MITPLAVSGSVTTVGTGVDTDLDFTGLAPFSIASRMLRLTLTVDNVNRLDECRLFLGLDGTFTDVTRHSFFHRTSGPEPAISGEEFQIDLKLAEISSAFGSISLSSKGVPSVKSGFTAVRLRVKDDTAGPVTVTVHSAELVPVHTNQALVSICFDDGLASVVSLAKPKMDALGFRGTNYPIAERIDSGTGWQTSADLADMADDGWEIGGHSYAASVHTAKYTGVTTASAAADLVANFDWVSSKYPTRSGRHSMAYPQGAYEKTTDGISVEQLAQDAGFCAGRTTLARVAETTHILIAGLPEPMPYRIHALSGISEVTDSPAKPSDLLATGGVLDKVAANGGWLVLTFHEIVTGLPTESNEIRQSDFEALMDGIAARGMQVVTVEEALGMVSDPDTGWRRLSSMGGYTQESAYRVSDGMATLLVRLTRTGGPLSASNIVLPALPAEVRPTRTIHGSTLVGNTPFRLDVAENGVPTVRAVTMGTGHLLTGSLTWPIG